MSKLYKPRDNNGHEKLLIEFPMIVDVDFGVIKTINNYYHTEYFCLPLLEVDNEDVWLGLIHDNTTTNPVNCVINPAVEDDADDFYQCLMMIQELVVYSQARMTRLYDMCKLSLQLNGQVEITVLCKNSLQEEVIQALFPKADSELFNTVIYDPDETGEDDPGFDVSGYSSLFLRHATSLFNYDNVIGKSIFLYECLTNIDIHMYQSGKGFIPNQLACNLFVSQNNIRIISLYPYDNSYFINNNYLYGDPDVNYNDNMVDEYLDPGQGSTEDDEEALEYLEYLKENDIPIDAPEDDTIVENDITYENEDDMDVDDMIKLSIPVVPETPDYNYLDKLLDEEEDYDE
jgi:hypothetical protein